MLLSIDFKDIEHLIFTKYGLRTEIERTNDDSVICHVKTIGFLGSTSNLLLSIDTTYNAVNSLKVRISGNMLSNFVIPKILKRISSKHSDVFIVDTDGNIIVNLAGLVQLKSFLELYTLNYVNFTKSAVNAEFTFTV